MSLRAAREPEAAWRRRCYGDRFAALAIATRVGAAALDPEIYKRDLRIRCWIFPVAVRGISASAINATDFGRLYPASRAEHHSIISLSVALSPSRKITTACTASPHFASGRPITATSRIFGWPPSTFSISDG